MRKWIILAAATLTFGAAGPAVAANCATVSFSGVTNFPQFDPISGGYTPQTITATLTRASGSSAVTARLILLDGDAGTPIKLAQSGPTYDVTSGGSSILFVSTHSIATNGEGALATFSGSSATASLSFNIPDSPNTTTDFTGGVGYSEPLKYSVECYKNTGGSGNGNALASDNNVSAFTASVVIMPKVSLTIASPQTINFGSFTTTTQNLNVGLKSTSSVNVAVSTAKGGQMVLSGAVSPYPSNSVIPYTMTLNGVSVANGTNLTNQTRAGVAGTSWPLVLTLTGGLPSGKIAGGYSDTITLTLTPGA